MLTVEASGICVRYGERDVLGGIDLRVPGGVTAIMGTNGSGKSTLFRVLALTEPPSSGEVRFIGREGRALPHDIALRRRVTLVLPRGVVFNASAGWNVEYGLRLRGMGASERKAMAAEALRMVGLGEREAQRALTLSSGEAQRLAIARALAIRPDVLLLDEPTASVDEENTEAIEAIVLELARRPAPPAIVIATHDRAQAARLAQRVLVMRKGLLSE